MKKIFVAASALFSVLSASAQETFNIKGFLSATNKAKVFLYYTNAASKIVDSTQMIDGRFEMNGNIDEPAKATLIIQETTTDPENQGTRISGRIEFFLDPGITSIEGETAENATITGGTAQSDFNALALELQPLRDRMKGLLEIYAEAVEKKDTAALAKIMESATSINEEQREIEREFIRKHDASYVSWDLLQNHAAVIDPESFEPLLNGMDPKFLLSSQGKELTQRLEIRKRTAIGRQAINFVQEDVDDKKIQLDSLRGSYIFLDFWASWCGPCRAENPNVLKAYQAFKHRNLKVLAVSLDDNRTRWINAIRQDNMPWIHVSDLKGWENIVAVQYGVKSIPQNLLIDPSGIIIARDLRGERLQEQLDALLK